MTRSSARSGFPVLLACLVTAAVVPGAHLDLGRAAVGSAGTVASAFGQSGSPVISVRDHGARGDGATNDTAAIQAAIDAAPAGASVYFPAGTYLVDNVRVERRARLRFEGEGMASVIKRLPLPGNTRHATLIESTDIVITNLAFDANGIERFGGVNLYNMKRVRIENTRFFDSRPQPPSKEDRYSFVFGMGSEPSEDVWIVNNQIEDLQLEVDQARRVNIIGNTVVRPYKTAGIGIFTVGDGVVAEDYLITRNRIIEPPGTGFAVHLDPPRSNRSLFRRIRITGNTIVRKATAGPAITVGTVDNSVSTQDNVFEDITIEGNAIEADSAARNAIIRFNTSVRANFEFKRITIKDNTILGSGAAAGWGMDLRSLRQSVVEGNTVSGVRMGISVSDALSVALRGNTVRASDVAFRFSRSRGGNRLEHNRILGSPLTRWDLVELHPSDVIVQR